MNKLFSGLLLILLLISINSCGSDDVLIDKEGIEDTVEQEEKGEEEEQEESEKDDLKIVWKNWYLSVPIDREPNSSVDKATSIFYEDIVADNLSVAASEYFYLNDDGSYTMYTKFTGYTTSGYAELNGSKYCRTELREFWQGNQTTDDNWSMSTGTHILESTLKVDHCEGNGQTYVAQIHGIETEGLSGSPATVKVQWKNGDLVIEYYEKPANGEPWTSDTDEKITIGTVGYEKFTIKIKIENGKLYYGLVCDALSIDITYTLVYDYVGNGYLYDNYFKTGNYFKHKTDYTQSSQVVLYEVVTVHE